MVTEELKKSRLEEINRDNLLQGLDSDGNPMPFYSDFDYGNEKFRMNFRNQGRWDLKLTGQYHQGIIAKIKKGEVTFHQKYRNQKITWLHDVLKENKLNPLGITQKQWEELQMKNSEAIREKIQQIING